MTDYIKQIKLPNNLIYQVYDPEAARTNHNHNDVYLTLTGAASLYLTKTAADNKYMLKNAELEGDFWTKENADEYYAPIEHSHNEYITITAADNKYALKTELSSNVTMEVEDTELVIEIS